MLILNENVMNKEKIKEIIQIAHEVVNDEEELHKFETFKIILEKLLEDHIVNSVRYLSQGTQPVGTQPVGTQPVGTQPVGTQPVGTQPVGILELTTKCRITVEEFKNVFLIRDKKVEIVHPIEGTNPKKMIIAAQCILAVHEVVFGQEWVQSDMLTNCFREIGIKNPGHNLAANMKKNSDLFLKRPSAQEYRLTTDKGRISAFETIRKLAKGEDLT